jgi:hypothetical protein
MLFWLRIRTGRYILHIHFLPYGNRTHTVLRGRIRRSSRLERWFWSILPILRPEYLGEMARAESLGMLALPLPFRELWIEIYRRRPGTAAKG